MKTLINITLLLATLVLGACNSRLKVNIAILDQSYFLTSEKFQRQKLEIYEMEVIARQKNGNYKDIRTEALDVVQAVFGDDPVKTALNDNVEAVQRRTDDIERTYASALKIKRDYDNSIDKDGSGEISLLMKSLSAFRTGDDELRSLMSAVDKLRDHVNVDSTQKKVDATIEHFQQTAESALLFGKLIGDPVASFVINAPPEYWKGESNKVLIRNAVGNADAAVIQDGYQEYAIKGIRNDASQAIKTMFSTFQLAINTMANAYGAGNMYTTTPNDSAQNYRRQIIEKKNNIIRSKSSAELSNLAVFNAILNESHNLDDDSKYWQSLENIKAIISANPKNQ